MREMEVQSDRYSVIYDPMSACQTERRWGEGQKGDGRGKEVRERRPCVPKLSTNAVEFLLGVHRKRTTLV